MGLSIHAFKLDRDGTFAAILIRTRLTLGGGPGL
jgi:hypothetical protein